MLQHQYFLNKHEDVRVSIRMSEQEFHQKHAPLYANHLFRNSQMMRKIENHLIRAYPNGSIIVIFDDMSENQLEKLKNGAITCGYELNTDGKIDVEAHYQMAKYSQNAFALGFDAINGDDLILVRDESLVDNAFILRYISDNDDEEDMEIIDLPIEKQIFAFA